MTLYKKLNSEAVEARQLTANNRSELLSWCNGTVGIDGTIVLRESGGYKQVKPNEYIIKLNPAATLGDFISVDEVVFKTLFEEVGTGQSEIIQADLKEEAPAEDVSKRTLEDKLKLPYVKVDLACGLNRHEREENEHIYIDGDPDENLDIVCDWNNIPLETGIVDVIHFSDAIEHVRTWEADKTMGEINRIMKQGAILWGTTPNRDFIIKSAYEGTKDEEWINRNLYGHQLGPGHIHYTTFTKPNLKSFLERYGFVEVEFGNIEDWIWFSCKKG